MMVFSLTCRGSSADAAAATVLSQGRGSAANCVHFTLISSTSKISTALGPILSPLPFSP